MLGRDIVMYQTATDVMDGANRVHRTVDDMNNGTDCLIMPIF